MITALHATQTGASSRLKIKECVKKSNQYIICLQQCLLSLYYKRLTVCLEDSHCTLAALELADVRSKPDHGCFRSKTHKRLKERFINRTKQDKTCKFSRKSSLSRYVQQKNKQFKLSCIS